MYEISAMADSNTCVGSCDPKPNGTTNQTSTSFSTSLTKTTPNHPLSPQPVSIYHLSEGTF